VGERDWTSNPNKRKRSIVTGSAGTNLSKMIWGGQKKKRKATALQTP